MNSTKILWRDTARPIKFFVFDARVLVGFGIWALHMSSFTFYLSFAGVFFFYLLEHFGITPPAAIRFAVLYFFGSDRMHISLYMMRRRARW